MYKSAFIVVLALSARRIGYQPQDLGERGAAFAYNRRSGPRPQGNAWHGVRIRAGEALGYHVQSPAIYDLKLPEPAKAPFTSERAPVAALFHATSKDDTKWPFAHWAMVGRELAQRGFRVVLPWGSERKRSNADRTSRRCPVPKFCRK